MIEGIKDWWNKYSSIKVGGDVEKFLSLKLVFLAIIVVGLVLYFKPSETKKILLKKRPSSTKVIHEGNLKDVKLFGEKINLF